MAISSSFSGFLIYNILSIITSVLARYTGIRGTGFISLGIVFPIIKVKKVKI